MSTILSPARRTIAPALWGAPVWVRRPGLPTCFTLTLAGALDLDAMSGATILSGIEGRVLARCLAARPGVWQTTDAATVPA